MTPHQSSSSGATPQAALVLSARGVRRRFGPVVALDGVSLGVAAGECVALVGESGSGKTTLLRSFNRLVEVDEGRVEIDGRDVRDLDVVDVRRHLGYVPQEGGLLPHWTVARNVALVPWLLGERRPDEAARRALDLVGLEWRTFAERWPVQLSGGQRQRVAMARALAASPRVVLLDEPFGALDAITRSDLQAMFQTLREATSIAAVLVTHDLHEACRLANRIAVMREGRVEQTAPPRELLEAPATPYVRALLERARATPEWAC
ncbi:MAG: ATP-binding cassette domain-containing protein [Acidobacteria bacterium]|nr:ATP-binding cassette domain-containing protein [Acidobacteriota bacterium]